MAGGVTTVEGLEYQLGFDAKAVVDGYKALSKAHATDAKRLEQLTKRTNKKLWVSSKDYYDKRSTAAALEATLQKQSKGRAEQVAAIQKHLTKANAEYSTAMQAGNEEEIEGKRQAVVAAKELLKTYKDLEKESDKALKDLKKNVETDLKADFKVEFSDDAKEVGEGMGEAWSAVASKDALGIGTGMAKAFSKVAAMKAKSLGQKMAEKGAKMKEGGGGGGMDKIFGPLLRTLGPVMSSLGKLLPILQLVGGGFMSLFKMFLDAESGAKEFQKGILATSSTLGFMTKNANNVTDASDELGVTLKGIRDAAFSLENIKLGINKEDFAAVTNELTSAGMRLEDFKDEAEGAYKPVNELGERVQTTSKRGAEAVQDLTKKTVELAVAYSRNMGVSVQEVSALMGEMKGQMGMPLEAIETAFGKISLEARDSGIAANQFFAIIRGMSADMSLFNNRMETAGKVLAKLTKVMDPRKAQQFLQSVSQFFKGQGLQDRLKSVLIAGKGGTQARLQKDIDVKMEGLGKDLQAKGMDPKLLGAAVRGGTEKLGEFLAQHGEKLSGAEKEAINDAAIMQAKVSSGDAVSLASALKDASPVTAYKQIQASSYKLFGKPIEKLTGVQLIAAENAANVNDEMRDQFVKFRVGLDLNRSEIAKRIEEGTATADDKKLLGDLGIKLDESNKKAAADALRQKDSIKVFEEQGHTQQQALIEASKTTDYAKETSKHQTSLMEKLQTLIDFMMNQFYNAIMGIWESIPFAGGEAKAKRETAEAARASGSATVNKALTDAGGDQYQMMHKLLGKDGPLGEKLDKAITEQSANLAALQASKAKAKDPKEQATIQGQIDALTASMKKRQEAIDQAAGGAGAAKAASSLTAWQGPVGDIAKKANEIWDKGGKTPEQAREEAKKSFSKEDQAAFDAAFSKAKLWTLDPKVMMGIVPAIEDSMDPSKQAEALKKAQEAVDQAGANDGTKQLAKDGHPSSNSISVHDKTAEPLLTDIAAALGASGDTGKTPELGEAETANSLAEEQVAEQEVTKATLADIYNVLRIKGIRFNQSHLTSDIKKVITEGTQEAMETALFEYALLTDPEAAKDALDAAMRGGSGAVTGAGLMKGMFEQAQTGMNSYRAEKAKAAAEEKAEAERVPEAWEERAAPSGGGGGGGVTRVIIETGPNFNKYFIATQRAADKNAAKREEGPG